MEELDASDDNISHASGLMIKAMTKRLTSFDFRLLVFFFFSWFLRNHILVLRPPKVNVVNTQIWDLGRRSLMGYRDHQVSGYFKNLLQIKLLSLVLSTAICTFFLFPSTQILRNHQAYCRILIAGILCSEEFLTRWLFKRCNYFLSF